MGNSVPMAVDSESQLVELRILLGILGVGDFSAGRRQGNKDKMEKGAEHTLPVYFFFSHKTAERRPSVALVGGSDPRWSLWGAGSEAEGGTLA